MQPHHWKTHTQKDVRARNHPWPWDHSGIYRNSITWGLSFRETNHQEKTWTWAQMFNPQNETRVEFKLL